jgi:L-seryl-tRNA(Ser) seleniumtransferase
MLALRAEDIERRCQTLAQRLRDGLGPAAQVTVIPETSQVGGGALPLAELPGFAVTLTLPGISAEALAERLRRSDPPLIGRIQEGRFMLNPRTLAPEEEDLVIAAVSQAVGNQVS